LEHLSFVLQTQVQAYESAVWETGKLPSTVSSARDLYTAEATDDLLAIRKLNRPLLAPGGPLNGFVTNYLRLGDLWRTIVPAIESNGGNGDRRPLQTQWTAQQDLIKATTKQVSDYLGQVNQDLV